MQKERCEEDLKGKYFKVVPDDYKRIHHGTVVVQDKKTKDVVLVVNFIPFKEMAAEKLVEFEKLTTTLVSLKSGASSIELNGAKCTGQMYALGWRAGICIHVKYFVYSM